MQTIHWNQLQSHVHNPSTHIVLMHQFLNFNQVHHRWLNLFEIAFLNHPHTFQFLKQENTLYLHNYFRNQNKK